MSYTSVMNLKRKLMKEFEKETGLTPDYREDWKAWLEENEYINPEPKVTSKTETVYMKVKLT